ncbi:MAG: sugar kinase [Planctomycetota bacterium]|nr:sugar kinase [Planctomycetota bacterium]
MLRLAPQGFMRLRQVIPGPLDATFGGGELNVAVSICFQGGSAAFLTAVPDNSITDTLVQELGKLGVDSSLVQKTDDGRFGIYFIENGANQRGGTVTYDRSHSSISMLTGDAYDWNRAFQGAEWFHITGITPAISEDAADAAMQSLQHAKAAGLTTSCDLNFRKKLWKWRPGTETVDLARETMRSLMPFIDVVIANEEDADLTLGIKADETDVDAGDLNIDGYIGVARRIVSQFPNVQRVAITLRESLSASHNNWGAMLFEAATDQAHFAPLDATGKYAPYEMRNIVDRVGAGDSFAGGLIFALNTPELAHPDSAIRYAVAASCLKHSIVGDFNYASRSEIEALMHGGGAGRVQR